MGDLHLHKQPVGAWLGNDHVLAGPALPRAATRDLPSEGAFDRERRRLTQILLNVLDEWQLDVLYYAPSRSLQLWGWSSTEGTLHPFRTIMAD